MTSKAAAAVGAVAGSRLFLPFSELEAEFQHAKVAAAARSCPLFYEVDIRPEVQIAFEAHRKEPEKTGVNEIVVLGNIQNAGEKRHRGLKAAMIGMICQTVSEIRYAVIQMVARIHLDHELQDLFGRVLVERTFHMNVHP
ncbi:hypothetical protein [Sinorhizobium glycinis]|uniref:hypothetical protein n=1 Tax=Sinorhizobium glycinis TaxID=1472378 RepID=UPI0012E83D10|nr:hypothetical protein [Sinorhizobium glycinis]